MTCETYNEYIRTHITYIQEEQLLVVKDMPRDLVTMPLGRFGCENNN